MAKSLPKHFLAPPSLLLLLLAWAVLFGQSSLAQAVPAGRLAADAQNISAARQGLQRLINYIDEQPDLFAVQPGQTGLPLNREQRLQVWQSWQRFLDYILSLDSMVQLYGRAFQQEKETALRATYFYYGFAAFVGQYRGALDYIERLEKQPAMHVLLNEPVPELGLAKGSYSRLKFRFLNVLRGAEFARLHVIYSYYQLKGESNPFAGQLSDDIAALWQAGHGKGPQLTAHNALRIVGDLGFSAWLPVQENVARTMGHIKVWRPETTLISQEQIKALKLEPGDILLERREWYATNAGIPGFWPHAALYVGSARERDSYFSDPASQAWLRQQGSRDGRLDSLLQQRYPEKYQLSLQPHHGQLPRVIEAIEHGVSLTSLEHSAAADSLAVLRPRLPRQAKARAILRAFQYQGRPYDFNFDFLTDSALVCSELVYKAYEPGQDLPGLSLALRQVMGRSLLSPNHLAETYSQEFGHDNAQFELVIFLDGHERSGSAQPKEKAAFINSWQRPKWHIWLQDMD